MTLDFIHLRNGTDDRVFFDLLTPSNEWLAVITGTVPVMVAGNDNSNVVRL